MDGISEDGKEIIKVLIVNEDGTETEVDSSTLNCIKLEISNSDDENNESEEDELAQDAEEDAVLLDNIKAEVIEDPDQEFGEIVLLDAYSDSEEQNGKTDKLRRHKTFHTCHVCGYSTFQKSHYRRHLTIHSKPEGIQCSICRKQMIAKIELADHMEEHRCADDRDRFQCNLCSYSSRKLTNVSQHTEIHYKPEKIKFECKKCDFSTTNRSLYKKHVNIHKNAKKNLRCPVCLIAFKTMALRKIHIQKYRSEEDPSKFQCPECSYNTVKFNNFKQHMVVHRNEYEIEMFLCPYCPFKSKRKTDLRQHVIVKHKTSEEVTLFKCDYCSYESRRGNHLTSHMKNRHQREIIMKKCGMCSYKTVSQVLIEKHCNIHSKVPEQFFLCNVCGSGFVNAQLLEDHSGNCQVMDTDEEVLEDDVYKTKDEVDLGYEGYSTEIVTADVEIGSKVIRKEVTMFYCQFPQCHFKTTTERDAKIHKSISHNKRGDDNRCPECTFHTTSRYLYLDHLKVHKIDIEHLKPHLCDICGTRWIRQGDLTRHMSVHWGSEAERRKRVARQENSSSLKELLECSMCHYTTRLRLCMFKHMKKHGDEHQQNFMLESLVETNYGGMIKQEDEDEYYDDESDLFHVLQAEIFE